MTTELRPTRFRTAIPPWKRKALDASKEFQPSKRKHPALEEFCQQSGRGRLPRSKADRAQWSWESPAGSNASLGPACLKVRPRAAGTIVLLSGPPARPTESKSVAKEVFRGRVDNITEGTAFVTLFSEDGEQMSAQWPERDLTRESIGKGDLFELTMTDTGSAVIPSIRKVSRRPIPDALWKEIEWVKAAYSDLQAEDVDGDEEV